MNRSRILVADDEEGIRESLSLILGDLYHLEFARDGEETLKKLSGNQFELALVDIKMPKFDGLEVLKRAKAAGNTIPILMLTAYQSVEVAKEAVKLGARDYLPKPFEREQILAAIHSVLAERGG